jgi:hypothetical protein
LHFSLEEIVDYIKFDSPKAALGMLDKIDEAIIKLKDIGKEGFIAHCIKIMALISFNEEEIREKYSEIENQICTDIKKIIY